MESGEIVDIKKISLPKSSGLLVSSRFIQEIAEDKYLISTRSADSQEKGVPINAIFEARGNELVYVKSSAHKYPEPYLKYKLGYSYNNFFSDERYVTQIHSDEIYDTRTNSTFKTHLPDSLYHGLSSMTSGGRFKIKTDGPDYVPWLKIVDIAHDREGNVFLLYIFSDVLYRATINKDKGLKKIETCIRTKKQSATWPKFYFNHEYIISASKGDDCFEVKYCPSDY